jgi:cytochrome c553
MKPTFVTSLRTPSLLLFAGMALAITPVRAEDGARLAAQLCATCHGVHGRSESPMFPRLDGQTPEYLQAQLKGFREHARGESDARSYMWGIASQLDDATIQSLADYYGSQTPTPGVAGAPELISKGKTIFEKGIPDTGVPACASCHGAQAQGAGAFPRLAGQHQAYLLRQIEVFKNLTRANSPVMSAVAHNLSTEEASAVATYLQSK